MDGNVDGTGQAGLQGVFKTLGYFVSCGYGQLRLDKDVQVEEDLSSDRPASEPVPLTNSFFRGDYLRYAVDGFRIDGGFGEVANAIAYYMNGDEGYHQADGDCGELVAISKAKLC